MIRESGQVLVIVFVALGVVLFTVLSVISGAQIYYQNAAYAQDAERATALAEAGVDKALNSLNKTGGTYTGESETALGDGSYSVTITSTDAATKVITSMGYIPGKSKARAKRTVKISTSKGVGAAFVYGVQVGEGGLTLGNSNQVQGTIYSNGSITAGNSNTITGDAWVAGGPQPNPDQSTECSGSNCTDFIFGKSVSGENRLDVAQSFKSSVSQILNKVSIKIKKIGNPVDLTVRIMRDSSGKPDKNGVLTSGTLFASLVTGSYGWIDVTFATSPALSAETTYWLMLDSTSDSSNYWSWQNDLAQSYTRGAPLWSASWSTGNPTWNNISGDLSFKTFMGGTITSITGGNNFTVSGSVHANTIQNLTIAKDAYFQTIVNSTVSGTSHPGSADPAPKVFPISDANVSEWRVQASNAGARTGDLTTCPSTLSSSKIIGNVTLGSNCTVTIGSPIWITGNLTLDSNNTFKLDPAFGSTSGVIVVDGQVTLNSNNKLQGTGVGSSLLMVLSNYDSRSNNISAIAVNGNGNSGVLYAGAGIIQPGNNNTFKELTAWGISLINNSVINYETGLSSTLFSSGPSGSYSLIKGTYQVK